MEMRDTIPPDIMAELQRAADSAAVGAHDPEAMRAACERMDRAREELRQAHGEMTVAVELIRNEPT
jgi:hypothetical protein